MKAKARIRKRSRAEPAPWGWREAATIAGAVAVLVAVVIAAAMVALGRKPLLGTEVAGALAWAELRPRRDAPSSDPAGVDLSGLRDSDPRAAELLRRMRAAADAQPLVTALEGRRVSLFGYVVPLDGARSGGFLLVPYFGACIHSPPPPANQVVHVTTSTATDVRTMDRVLVRGTLRVARSEFEVASSGYRLDATEVELH